MTNKTRMILVGVIAPLAIAAVGIIAILASIPSLPSPVATHWGPSGTPNAFGSPVGLLVIVPIVVIGYSAFAFVVARSGHDSTTVNQRIILAIGPAFAALLTVIVAGSILIQAGLADAQDAPSIGPIVALGFGLGIVAGVAAWFLLPSPTPFETHPATLPVLELGATQRVAWMQRAEPSRAVGALVLTILVLAIGGGGISLALVAPPLVFAIWLAIMLLVGVLAVSSLFWKVAIGGSGIVVRSVLGFPRFVVPIADISAATVIDVNPPVQFGGWGVRWGGRGRIGVITRAGQAIEITRRDGRALVVTVPQSAQGAALLNALAARA